MGAYLTTPITVKESEDGGQKGCLRFGASSMQGWRITQEDAHCCLLDFDPEAKTSFFAVFDGHGGAEVAQYTAAHLPTYVRALEAYKASRLGESLEQAFLGFDATLVDAAVVSKLKSLAGDHNEDEDEEEEDDKEAAALCEEAEMPLEQILERYGGAAAVGPTANKAVLALKKKDKFKSPALRAKAPSLQVDDNSDSSVRLQLETSLINGHSESESEPGTGDDISRTVSNGSTPSSAAPKTLEATPASSKTPVSDAGGDVTQSSEELSKEKKSSTEAGGDGSKTVKCTAPDSSVDSTSKQESDGEVFGSPALASGAEDRSVSSDKDASKDKSESNDKSVSDNSVSDDKSVSEDKNLLNACSLSPIEATNGKEKSRKDEILQEILDLEMSRAKLGETIAEIEEKVDDLEEEVAELNSVVEELGEEDEGKKVEEGKEKEGEDEGESKAELEEVRGETKVKITELNAEIARHKEKLVGLVAQRMELRHKITELKKTKVRVVKEEEKARRLAAGEEEDSGDSENGEEEEEDMDEDDSDDEDDVPDDEEDDEEEEEEGECAGMMGCGEEPGMDSGCTAVVALLRDRELHVANAGDSRCVLCRAGVAVEMSFDHKPEDAIESARILKAGGRVTCDGRVNGGLNLSRAIGDHSYKQNKTLSDREQMITSLPDIKSIVLEDKDEFIVIACDGIWNVMSSQEVVDFVRKRLQDGENKLSKICEEMFDFCISPDTSGDGTGCDNMTCVIVELGDPLSTASSSSRKRSSEDNVENGDSTAPPKRRKEEVDNP